MRDECQASINVGAVYAHPIRAAERRQNVATAGRPWYEGSEHERRRRERICRRSAALIGCASREICFGQVWRESTEIVSSWYNRELWASA